MGYARELAELATAYNTGSPLTHRNKIINGAMTIDQRNAGTAINSTASTTIWPVDRFVVDNFGSGTVSCQRSTVAPAGFVNSLGLTVSATDTPSAGDYLILTQQIEGFNTADLDWGTASAKVATLSFWVRSSVTGTYGGSIRGGTSNYSYPINYSISAANTWEYKTITIPGTALVAFETGNARGFQVMWDLGSGTNFNGTLNTWQSGSFWRTSGCVNWVSNAAATFYITGVQLEAGRVATPFEYRQHGTELALCQRYFYMICNGNSQTISVGCYFNASLIATAIQLPVEMRTIPSLYQVSGTDYFRIFRNDAFDDFNSFTGITRGSSRAFAMDADSTGASGTAGQSGPMNSNNSLARLGFSAEL